MATRQWSFLFLIFFLLCGLRAGASHIDNGEDVNDEIGEESCTASGTCGTTDCCEDTYDEECKEWAEDGECEDNPQFMLRTCPWSCDACGPCEDTKEECPDWAEEGECHENPQFMLRSCRKSCDACGAAVVQIDYGVDQVIDEAYAKEIEETLRDMQEYFENVRDNPETSISKLHMLHSCRNKDASCAFWKVHGECEANRHFMQITCPAICQICNLVPIEERCPLDPNAPKALNGGDLDKMFTNMTTLSDFQQYQIEVVSRPDYIGVDDEKTAKYKIGPWIVIVDNFLSDEEVNQLIKLGGEEGYERSADIGEMNPDGTFEKNINMDRTSVNSWCQRACYEDPIAKRVMKRIEDICGIPEANSEYLQLLKYDVGQFYRTHHDMIDFDIERQSGVRILTVFLYLNDVEAGGGTNFPELDITVMPKKGRALIWPNVLNEDPDQKDERTFHQALEVEMGIKYGANAWIHQHDYKGPDKNSCS